MQTVWYPLTLLRQFFTRKLTRGASKPRNTIRFSVSWDLKWTIRRGLRIQRRKTGHLSPRRTLFNGYEEKYRGTKYEHKMEALWVEK